MKNIIKKIVIITFLTTTLVGCTIIEGKKQEKHSVLYYRTTDNEEIYVLTSKDKEQKIAGGAVKFTYAEALNNYVVIDKDKNLFTIDKDGNKNEIDVFIDYIDTPKADSTTIYYINEDGELYEKEKGKDKSKLVSRDVKEYNYIDKNDIVYKKKDSYLYIKRENKESSKIAEQVSKYEFSKDFKNIIYRSKDGLYLDYINEDKKETLVKEECLDFQVIFIGKNNFVYLVNKEEPEERSKLYYKAKGKEPIKLASNVNSMKVTLDEKGLYYLDSQNTLYFMEFKSKEPVEVLKDVFGLENVDKEHAYVIDINKTLKKVNQKGEAQELIKEVVEAYPYGDKVVALNKENKLFIDDLAVDEGIESYKVNDKDIVYLKTNGEVFMKSDNKDPKLVIEDYKEYKNLYFMNNTIYTNLLTLEELSGYWTCVGEKDFMITFTQDSYSETTAFSTLNTTAAQLKNKCNEITLYLNGMKDYTRNYSKVDKDVIEGGARKFKRVDKSTYEAYITKLKNIKECAINYLGEPINCVSYYDIEDKRYYLYANTNNPYSYVLIDENAKGYKYEDFIKNNSLVPIN